MNFKKRANPKKRNARKRVYKKRPNIRAIVKRELSKDIETKIWPATIRGTSFNDSAVYTLMPTQYIQQGTDTFNRVGRQVYLRYLRMTGNHFGGQAASVYRPTIFRIIVMWSNSTKLSAGASFGYNTGFVATSISEAELFIPGYQNVTSALIDSRNGHQVLFDKKYVINPYSNVDMVKPFDITIPLFKKCEYNLGTTPTLFTGKNLYICVMADVVGIATSATASPIQELNLALTYKDA